MSAGETNAEGASRLFGRLHQRPALATRLFIAIATSIFAIYARLWLGDEFGVTPTYITFYPAVVIISFLCGFHFGLLSLLMFFIASDYYLFEPKSTFKLPLTSDMIGLFIFSTTCLAISGGSELMYRAQQKIVGNERRLRDQSSSEAALSLQALRENEERLRLFVEHAPAAVAMFDKDMRCLAASRRWMDDYGLEGPIGRSQFDVFPKLPERWKAVHRRVLAGVSLSAEDDRVEKLDGTAQYLRWEALPWRTIRGEIGGVMIAAEDVTARKQAEEALRASEHRLNLVLSAGRLATWDLHLPTNEVVWSDEHFRMLGYEIGEVAPSYRAWASRLQPEDREGTETLFAQAMKDGREYHAEYRSLWPDGTVRWLEGRGSCYRDAQGNVTRCCGVTMDITERKRAEAALKDADRRKDEFLATLAHELRNPLAPIRSGLHVLRRAGAQGEKAERVQAMMERQVDHLIRLVDDLLEVSRISRGKIVLLKEPMDLATVIKHSVEMSRGLIDAGALELRLMLPEEPLPIEADAVRLTQVFSNLLNNAAKFTNSGGRIEIAAERAGGQAVVSVADTGVGIAKDMLPRVFDLFAQASNGRDRSSGGLGIGLSLVRSLVELHGGAVEAHSEGAGRGSRFVVRLPLSSKIEAGAPPSKLLKCEATASRRVLVIDDTPDVADSFALLLETLGANVRVAHSGVEGLATCAEFAPELVFLDIGMPGMDGFETARRMRELPAGQKATLIALTGWGEEGTRARVKEAGFDGHLTKPADVEEVEMLLGSTSRVS